MADNENVNNSYVIELSGTVNQTIILKYRNRNSLNNGYELEVTKLSKEYSQRFNVRYGTTWFASISGSSGYIAGTLSPGNSGVVVGDVVISASDAILDTENLPVNSDGLDGLVNFYRGTRSRYDIKKELGELDSDGLYFTVDGDTGKRCIFLGEDKFSDIKSGWEDSIVLSDSGVLQQISKDSTDYSSHFNEELSNVNSVINSKELEENTKTFNYMYCFDNIQDMRESRFLLSGMTSFIKGKEYINDDNSSFYNIRFKDSSVDEDDGSNIIFLDNGNVAERISSSSNSLDISVEHVYDASDVIDITSSDVSEVKGNIRLIGKHLVVFNVGLKISQNSNSQSEDVTYSGGHIREESLIPKWINQNSPSIVVGGSYGWGAEISYFSEGDLAISVISHHTSVEQTPTFKSFYVLYWL